MSLAAKRLFEFLRYTFLLIHESANNNQIVDRSSTRGNFMTINPIHIEESFADSDGLRIFFRLWRPAEKSRGVVVIVPGFNSHSGYYSWVAEQLVSDGLAVYAVDLRGRGLSDGERYYIENLRTMKTMSRVSFHWRNRRSPAFRCSCSGIAPAESFRALFTLDHQRDLAGLICESFAYEVPAPDFALAVLKGLSHLAPHAHVLRLKNEDFSRDPAVVEQMNDDPLIAHETQPTKTVAEMARADERLRREFPSMVLPVLILHGTDDKRQSPAAVNTSTTPLDRQTKR
jgi:alpha-beta hydrolase superfamily lysophospholipase